MVIIMDKAEKYLNERLNLLSDERAELLTKIEETNLEAKEIECKVKDLQENIDDAFQIFSPRTKKNDFIKNEIEELNKKINALKKIRDDYEEKANSLLEDINVIKDVLSDDVICDETECDDIQSDEICFEGTTFKNTDLENLSNENIALSKDTMERLIVEKERLLIAGKIEEKTLQSISNLIHKCEICGRVLEVDIGRAKLEIEVMSKSLNEMYSDIKKITDDLRKPVSEENDIRRRDNFNRENFGKGNESDKKISVKKLSMSLSTVEK